MYSKKDWYSERQATLNKEQVDMDNPIKHSNPVNIAMYNDSKQQLSNHYLNTRKEQLLNDCLVDDDEPVTTTTQTASKAVKDTTQMKSIDAGILNECKQYGIKPVITTQEFTNLAEYNASLLNTDVVETDTPVETTTQTASKAVKDTTQMTSKTERIATEILNLRIDKGLSWKKCRAILELSNNEFHKGIRLTDVYRETAIGILNTRIADGWETKRSLSILTGVDGIEDMLNTDEVVETETTTLEDSTYVEVLNTDEVVDDDCEDDLTDYEKQMLSEWREMRDLNNDVVDTDEVVETTTQTDSEPVETTTKALSIDDKLNALLATFGK